MRIAIALQELLPLRQMLQDGHVDDGTYVVQGYLAAALRARGHQLTFIAPRDIHEVECATDLNQPALVSRTWSNSWWFRLAASVVWKCQQALGVPYLNVFSNHRLFDAGVQCLRGHDVVYERNGMYNVGVARAARHLNLPYIVFFEADQLLEQDYMNRAVSRLQRWRAARILRENLRTADSVICVSEQAKARAVDAWSVPPDRIAVFSNGVDLERFRPDAEARRAVREKLGVTDEPVIVFVGTFFKWHDVGTLLQAFTTARTRTPRARLVLVGDGIERPAFERLSGVLGLADSVHFLGLINHLEVPRVLSAADIAVAPYPAMTHDLWLSPLKLFEYMAAGLAIIGSRVGQVANVLTHEQSALLVAPGDAAALAAALDRLIVDPALRQRLGAQACEHAVARHSWARYAEKLEALFASVAEQRTRGRGAFPRQPQPMPRAGA
ncbi:MAG: glycosyltransferase family 4 protein [Vicinamibacterales bacterium]